MRVNGTLYFLLSDHLGSTSLTTDANGNLISELRYTAWGMVRYASGTTPTKYTYTGQYSNVSDFGLMYYNARWYDPYLNRFTQADTVVPGGVQGYDRYAYVSNSPERYTDPSGHRACGEGETVNCNGRLNHPSTIATGCGNIGQTRCNGNPPSYGNGLIGPPVPANWTSAPTVTILLLPSSNWSPVNPSGLLTPQPCLIGQTCLSQFVSPTPAGTPTPFGFDVVTNPTLQSAIGEFLPSAKPSEQIPVGWYIDPNEMWSNILKTVPPALGYPAIENLAGAAIDKAFGTLEMIGNTLPEIPTTPIGPTLPIFILPPGDPYGRIIS